MKHRPAETTGVGAGLVAIIAASLGADTTQVAILAGITGALPATITWLVDHGGVRGALHALWQGRRE